MAGMVKKRPGDSSTTGQANNPKHLVAPRQRGIPTRVCRRGDNRNLRPTSQIQLSSSESLENKDQELNGNLDGVEAKTGSISRRSDSSLSGSAASVHKANSVKLITECDNRSQLTSCESAFVSDQDVSKPVNRVKASLLSAYNPGRLRSGAKTSVEQSSPVRTAQHGTESSHNSVRSPKRLAGNRNCFGKNVNKLSSSDETCALKSAELSLCLNGAAGKEISVSVDHIVVGEDHRNSITVGLLNANEVSVSDSSVISEPAVSSKEMSREKVNERSLERAGETKRLTRGRLGTENNGNRSNLRPHSSGGLNTSRNNQKFRQSTSNERTNGNKDSVTRCANRQPASDSGAVNSSEVEQEGNKRRKSSGGTGIKFSPLKETSGRCEGANSPKTHAVARNQNVLVTSAGNKADKGLKNHVNAAVSGLYKASVLPSRKADIRGRCTSAKLSSVPKILVSHEPRDLEVVPVNSQLASSGLLQNNGDDVTVRKSSPVSCSAAEAPPVNNLGPADNTQDQPVVQVVNGDANEGSGSSRRLFHARPHAANSDERPSMGCCVEMGDEISNIRNHHVGAEERRCASESEDVVVLDGEMYQQMMDDFKALKMTILRLQHVLIENGTVESQIGDNEWKSTVKAHCYNGGDEMRPGDGHIQVAHVCQENIRLQNKVDELEKLLQEREQMINILRQKSMRDKSQAQYDIKMLPGIESPASEADVELHHKNNCCTTERNLELRSSSLSSDLSLTHDCQSKIRLSSNTASPPSSPRKPRFQHTSPVLHFAWKSEKHCSPTTTSKAFVSNECEMHHLCNDAGESWLSHGYDKHVGHVSQDDGRHVALASANSVDMSQTVETSPSKRLRKATQGGQEDEEVSGDYSMFDYNCSVDSDSELGPGIYDAPECVFIEATENGGAPVVKADHCIAAGKLINEESEQCRFIACESRPGARGVGNDPSCVHTGTAEADTCDNNMQGSAQNDQNFNEYLIENGYCDHLGNFDQSLLSNSLVSPSCTEQEKNIYKMLHSVEPSGQRISKDVEDSAFSLPVSLDRQTAELWSCGDLKLEKALIKQPPKRETSSIQSLPCNPVFDEVKSPKPVHSSQSSNVTLSKVPNRTRTLLRMPKCHASTTSSSSVASAPPSGICSSSEAVHVVPPKPEASNVRQRHLKELISSRLPSLRFSRVQKLPTPISK